MKATKAIVIDIKDKQDGRYFTLIDNNDQVYEFHQYYLIDLVRKKVLIIYNLEITFDENLRGRNKINAAVINKKQINLRALNTLNGSDRMIKYCTQLALVYYGQNRKMEVLKHLRKTFDYNLNDYKDCERIIISNRPADYMDTHLDTIVRDKFIDALCDVIGWKR